LRLPAKEIRKNSPVIAHSHEIKEQRDSLLIELNQADSAELTLCTGIGPSFSRRIILYRKMLGGFYDRNQLLEVYGMDSVRFQGFQHQVTVNPNLVRKMDLDSVSFKELLSHPYFEFYLVKAIFNYKGKKKGLDSLAQLKSMPEIYPSLYDKISPYLEVGRRNGK
jgi:DNA uptake protein ComE-like DNA-binding protein